ncbi:peroxiredoxin-like family protein [Agaribacter marinus]|uniref:thioredoxin-dependent peroxiredoxin n=1 Tax=Agaribacter marinus TaxID=1431249 RepID=A0AA37T251_9ALTE|nr:peroxiredoxin-like family protein [Agaribacter marinus]GLR70255.1 peroxiredoxin [Agaribacter marinus]
MSLNEQIRESIASFRENLPPELVSLIEQGAGEISAMAIVEHAINVGDKVPDFTLKDRNGSYRSLTEYLTDGPLVITFYRGVWCPFCNMQLAAYNAVLNDIHATGAQLVAITPETENAMEVLAQSNAPSEAKESAKRVVDFDILHDAKTEVARKFGLVFELPSSHKRLLDMLSFDVERANGDNSYAFADPATYVVGADGFVKWAFVPNNYRKRAEPEDILKALNNI